MKQGFSLIEILIAVAILTGAIAVASATTYRLPFTIQRAYQFLEEAIGTDARLSRQEVQARTRYDEAVYDIPADSASSSVEARAFADGAAILTQGTAQSLITDPGVAADEPCQPFLSGDWLHPRILGSYELAPAALLPSGLPAGRYPVSAVTISGNTLAVGVADTARMTDPSLFFFRLSETDAQPAYENSFDMTPRSKDGVPALASGNGYVYVANGASSISTTSCSADPVSCAQLQVFDTHNMPAERIGYLQIPAAQPTYAVLSSGATAPASAIAYRDGYAYLGLRKTAQGQELQAIDVHDPMHPADTAGASIGHSVTAIVPDRHALYVGTDDNDSFGKAVLTFSLPADAAFVAGSSYRFPGAGFVRALVRSDGYLFSGRTFAQGNSEEFAILAGDASSSFSRIGGSDIGVRDARQGVYGLLIRDFMAFLLADRQLISMNIHDPAAPVPYASLELPHGAATSMACRENTLYIGSADGSDNGYITVVTSS